MTNSAAEPAAEPPPRQPALLAELSRWASRLQPAQLPDRVVRTATTQLLSQLAAIRAGLSHPLGRRLVDAFGPPLQPDPAQSAAVLAALGSWLNLDDTAYAGHLGPSTIAVPVAFARARKLDGRDLLTAIVAADECAARITAAATLGPLRGQSALHTHLAGAVAGRLHCEQAGEPVWRNALALAFSTPPLPVMHGFLGSDAKLLHVLPPLRIAMDACAAANAGLIGAPNIMEHPDGFLHRFCSVPLPDELVLGLGTRWHTDTVSFKLRPGGPGIDAAVDCCLRLHRQAAAAGIDLAHTVAGIDVEASAYTVFAGGKAEPYLRGSDTPLSALLLTAPYAVASALLTGDLTVADFARPALTEQRRWQLAARVRLIGNDAFTVRLLSATAPFGEALRHAGDRAEGWLRAFCGPDPGRPPARRPAPSASFEQASKHTPARVRVTLLDGRVMVAEQSVAAGAVGAGSAAERQRLVRQKFLAQGGSAEVADALAELPQLSAGQVHRLIERALEYVW